MRRLWPVVLLAACHSDGDVLAIMDATISEPKPWDLVTVPDADFYGVWAGASTNVVAVGVSRGDSLWPGVIARFDGAAWTSAPSDANLYGVFAATAVGEWAGQGKMTYWNGTSWTSPEAMAATQLNGTWAPTPSTFVTGNGGKLYYTNETGIPGSWQNVLTNTTSDLFAIWGFPDSFNGGVNPIDVYVAGANGTILRDATSISNPGPWQPISHGGSRLRAIWGSSASDVYVVGEAPAVILHTRDKGTTWTEAQLPISAIGFYGIAGRSPNDIWVIGATGGTALHSAGNDEWTTEPLPSTVDLFGISIAPSGDVFAVGRNGTIVHRAP